MANLEEQESWRQILQLKDSLSLRDLAARFDTSPGAISAAFKRTGTSRSAAIPSQDDLPPEPGEERAAESSVSVASPEGIRPGSKDALVAEHLKSLGQIPDAEIAKLAGVSVRTVASFRARNDIAGYRGPRRTSGKRAPRKSRIDPFVHLLGQVPDRVVAEQAGVSLNAVRNYRVKRGIPAAGRQAAESPRPATRLVLQDRLAWRVTWRNDAGEETHAVLVATDLIDAARQAKAAGVSGEVVGLTLAGRLLD